MTGYMQKVVAEADALGNGQEFAWRDWRGEQIMRRTTLDELVIFCDGTNVFSASAARSCVSVCERFVRNWVGHGFAVVEFDHILDGVLNCALHGPLVWRDWRGTLAITEVAGHAFAVTRDDECIGQFSIGKAARRFIEEWGLMNSPTSVAGAGEPRDILRRKAADISAAVIEINEVIEGYDI